MLENAGVLRPFSWPSAFVCLFLGLFDLRNRFSRTCSDVSQTWLASAERNHLAQVVVLLLLWKRIHGPSHQNELTRQHPSSLMQESLCAVCRRVLEDSRSYRAWLPVLIPPRRFLWHRRTVSGRERKNAKRCNRRGLRTSSPPRLPLFACSCSDRIHKPQPSHIDDTTTKTNKMDSRKQKITKLSHFRFHIQFQTKCQ